MSYIVRDMRAAANPPQSELLTGQVFNNAGGASFQLDDWKRLDRFLILGSEGNTYYATEKKMTRDNCKVVERLLLQDGKRVVDTAVEVSVAGRAPKADPALMVIALALKANDVNVRRHAASRVPEVARIGTHLYHLAAMVKSLGGWGRLTKRAFADWFQAKPLDELVYQLIKYQGRDGWSSRDLLRLTHPIPSKALGCSEDRSLGEARAQLYKWVVSGELAADHGPMLSRLHAFEQLKKATSEKEVIQLIEEANLPRECVPTEKLTRNVWATLARKMPITATIRNLATLTRHGLLDTGGGDGLGNLVVDRITNEDIIKKGRVHPIQMLSALKVYKQGHGERGGNTWTPVSEIVDALDSGFYRAFGSVNPMGGHVVLALDISASMDSGSIAGVPGLTPRDASIAMALVTKATEKRCTTAAFATGYHNLEISPRRRLDDNILEAQKLSGHMTGTDCALPMLDAMAHKVDVDTFVVYTDNETWAGKVHPHKALEQYRRKMGKPNAKLIVVGVTATEFTIANPQDPGMLDVVGFDTAAPNLMSDFGRI